MKTSLINSIASARRGFSGNDETQFDAGYADPNRLYGVGASGLTDENNGFGGGRPAASFSDAAPPGQSGLSEQTAPAQHAALSLDNTAAATTPVSQTRQTQPLTISDGGTAEIRMSARKP